MDEREQRNRARMKSHGKVYLEDVRKGGIAWLWDGTEIKVLLQGAGSTRVRYVESGVAIAISHKTEVFTAKPRIVSEIAAS
jgi:hypothetical protein